MSAGANANRTLPPRAAEGIACVVTGMILFVGQDGLMKAMIGEAPVWMLMALRGITALIVLTPMIIYLGPPHRFRTPLWPLHLLRAALFGFGFSMFYAAFPFMGLADVTTIFFSAPLMIALLAAVFLGESVGIHRISALVVGFAGVLIAMNPNFSEFDWVTLLPVICAFSYACGQVLARRIGDHDTTLTTGLYTIALSSALVLPVGWLLNQWFDFSGEFAHLGWWMPRPQGNAGWMLALLGLNGMIAYLLISRAYQITSASLVAPFDYIYLPFATAMAWIVWAEVPSTNTLIGMVLIMGSGLYVGYRELRVTGDEGETLLVAQSSIAPGNPTAPMPVHADIEPDA